ncbi:hypothetical protein [Microbacterium sp. GXF7504]
MSETTETALPFREVVSWLRENLGARLTAYIGGVTRTSIVMAWVEGAAVPDEQIQQRLRDAYRAAVVIVDRFGGTTVSTWFLGMNPTLGDRAPAKVLREDEPVTATREVFAAATSFAYVD